MVDETEIREYSDVGTLTEPVVIRPAQDDMTDTMHEAGSSNLSSPTIPQDHPPAYTADPEPVSEQEVLDRTHPRRHGREGIVEDEYNVLVDALGVRCSVLEEEIKLKRADREKIGIGEFVLYKLAPLLILSGRGEECFDISSEE